MHSELETQSNVERIRQSIAEVHASLSELEAQIKLGSSSIPPNIESEQIGQVEEEPSSLKNDSFPTHSL